MQLFAKLRLSAFLVGLVATAAATEFTVAALKVMPALGDSAANYARFETLARQTAAGGAHLVVTPECCLDGYLGSPKFPPPA